LEKKVDQIQVSSQKLDQKVEFLIELLTGIKNPKAPLAARHQVRPPFPISRPQNHRQAVFLGKNTVVVEMIQEEVAKFYGIDVKHLRVATRVQRILLPRQVAIFLLRKLTDLSLKEIGKLFGGKDHTTIMHCCQRIQTAIEVNDPIQKQVEAVELKVLQAKREHDEREQTWRPPYGPVQTR
jgi:hypothetical protein